MSRMCTKMAESQFGLYPMKKRSTKTLYGSILVWWLQKMWQLSREIKINQFVANVVDPFKPKEVTLQISSSIFTNNTHNCMQIQNHFQASQKITVVMEMTRSLRS